jgi:hypothetical protein
MSVRALKSHHNSLVKGRKQRQLSFGSAGRGRGVPTSLAPNRNCDLFEAGLAGRDSVDGEFR